MPISSAGWPTSIARALTTAVVLSGVAPADRRASRMHARRRSQPADGDPAAARARDRAVGHAEHHLHLGHDRPVEGRAVVVPALYSMGTESFSLRSAPTTASWSTCRCSMSAAPARSIAMLAIGGSIAIVEAFDTASFWRVVTRDRHHRLRAARRRWRRSSSSSRPAPQDRDHTLQHRHHGAAVRGRRGVLASASAATSTPSST